MFFFFFFQAEDGIRDPEMSRGLGDVYKRQFLNFTKDIGADVDKSGRGLGIRSNRYTMYVEDMKVVKLQEEKDTGSCEISAAENFINLV